jgi:hypothetical protein
MDVPNRWGRAATGHLGWTADHTRMNTVSSIEREMISAGDRQPV